MTDNTVTFQHPIYKEQKHRVALCNDIYDGYDSAKNYLLSPESENEKDFNIRVQLADYNNLFERIITSQVGQVFRKQIIYNEVPDKFVEWLKYLKFEQHLADATTRADIDGYGLIMLDMPVAGGEPYMVQIKRESLINWRYIDGKFTLAVIAEQYEVDEGFKLEYKTQYRVLHEDGNIDIWRAVEGKGMEIFESITTSYDFLPLYLADFGTMPPMYNLAVMNSILYNHDSSLGSGLFKVGMPSLLTKLLGLDENNSLKLGVNYTVNTDDKDADMKWVEFEGKSIPVYMEFIKKLEVKIAERALQLDQVGVDQNKTATQVNRENSESNARLSDISSIMEFMANDIYEGLVRMKYKQEIAGSIELARDYKDEGITNNYVQQMTNLWVTGAISQETLLTSLIEKEQITIEDVQEEIKLATEEMDARIPEESEQANTEPSK